MDCISRALSYTGKGGVVFFCCSQKSDMSGSTTPSPSKEVAIALAKAAAEKAKKLADDEFGMKLLLERIRQLYFKYQFVGDIEITRTTLMVEASLSCSVDGTGTYIQDPEVDGVKVSKFVDAFVLEMIKIMVLGVDKMLQDLLFRSTAYWDKSYKDDMTLSGNFTWSDPNDILGASISCSATMKSMHDHIFKKNEFELTYGLPVNRIVS